MLEAFVFKEFDDMAATSYAKNVEEQITENAEFAVAAAGTLNSDTGASAGAGVGGVGAGQESG